MPLTAQTYEGRLVSKPPETFIHNDVVCHLAFDIFGQLSRRDFHVRINSGRVRYDHDEYRLTSYVPDAFVMPDVLTWPLRDTHRLEVYRDPLPPIAAV